MRDSSFDGCNKLVYLAQRYRAAPIQIPSGKEATNDRLSRPYFSSSLADVDAANLRLLGQTPGDCHGKFLAKFRHHF